MEPNILRTLSYGMYAVGVKGEKGPSACIVNTVMQVTNTAPLMITLSMSRDNYSCECIKKHKLFTVSVLSEDTSGAVVGALGFTSGRNGGKLSNIRHKVLREGVPVIKENTCCWFLCRMVDSMESTTHTLFLAEIIAGSEKAMRTPMTYEYYRRVIKGGVPQNAPVYVPLRPVEDGNDGEMLVCTVCGYLYNDPDTSFEELPAEWVCPICGMPKSAFVRK